MTKEEFISLRYPQDTFSPELKALWYDRQGDWKTAHDLIDQLPGKSAARVHAYLHRKEGDQWNANYWYSNAGEKCPKSSLEDEWSELLERFLTV